jgi:hypothetical protein
MTTAKLDLLLPANYARLLKTELKDSAGAVVPLHYLYDRADKQPAVIFIGEVGAGMLTLMKKEDSGIKSLKGKIAEAEKAFLFEIGSQLTDKALTVQLLDVGIRNKPVLRVKDLDAALEQLKGSKATTSSQASSQPSPGKTTAPGHDESALLEKAEKAFAGMKPRVAIGLKRGADNHRQRLVGVVKEYEELIKAKSGKEAVVAVVGIAKVLELIEQSDPLQSRILDIEHRRDQFKDPALHAKHLKEIGEACESVRKAITATDPFNPTLQGAKLDAVETLLDTAAELAHVFRDQKSDHETLAKEIASKDRAAVAKTPKKKELEQLELPVSQLGGKAPKDLLVAERYEPFTGLIEAEKKLLAFLREALKPSTPPDLSTVSGRKQAYIYDASDTWVMNPVAYRNGTSSSSMSSKQLDLLSKGQLRSNTINGTVLKVGFEGHTHVDGGSGGVAFVYQLDDQYKVTPIVVDTANSRGNNKDKNKYKWNTGGELDYFPPKASY